MLKAINLLLASLAVLASFSGSIAQTPEMFQGQPSLRFQIDRNLSMYATARSEGNAPALVFDISCERIPSKGKALLWMAEGAADLSQLAVDMPRVSGKMLVTEDKIIFQPSDETSTLSFVASRSEAVIKHTSYGEELKIPHGSLHVFVHFQPVSDSTGQLAWSDGSGAKALEAGHPKGNAAAFVDFFHNSLSDFAASYRQVKSD